MDIFLQKAAICPVEVFLQPSKDLPMNSCSWMVDVKVYFAI